LSPRLRSDRPAGEEATAAKAVCSELAKLALASCDRPAINIAVWGGLPDVAAGRGNKLVRAGL